MCQARFIEDPAAFLREVPLIVSVDPDFQPPGNSVASFRIAKADYLTNMDNSKPRPCELRVDETSDLRAYWCTYQADTATLLTVGNEANFMFTANMTGCSFAVSASGQPQAVVSHSNASSFGALLTQHGVQDEHAAWMQKARQQHMVRRIPGMQEARMGLTHGADCTTVVGVRSNNVWSFFMQVNTVSAMGNQVSVASIARR